MNIRPMTLEEALASAFVDTQESFYNEFRTHTLTADFLSDVGPFMLSYVGNGNYHAATYGDEEEGTEAEIRAWIKAKEINLQKFVGYHEEEK